MEHEPPEILRLLGNPLRWRLVVELGRSDLRVNELVALVGEPQNTVSYHLAELRRAGLVTAHRSAADGRDVYYRADLPGCRHGLALASRSLHPALALTSARPVPAIRPRPRRTPRLLFVCTGNSARSQIAEALVEHRTGGAVRACSAGSHPKALHPNAVKVMAARGIDIAGRPAKPLSRFARSRFDRVVTLCDKVREICPEFPGHPAVAHWSVADPAAAGATDTATYPAFERVAQELEDRVELLLAEFTTHPEGTDHD